MSRRAQLGKLGLWVAACYFTIAVLANARVWLGRVDDQLLEARAYDYAWELQLIRRALSGEWVGREFAYPIGPLWQAIASLPLRFAEFSGPTAVAGMHLIFPLCSLGLAGALAWWLQPAWSGSREQARWPGLAAGFAGLALLALHDDVRSFRALFSLAIVMAWVRPGDRDVLVLSWRRAALLAALVSCAVALSFDTGLLALVSVVSVLAYAAVFAGGARRASASAAKLLLTLIPLQLLAALVISGSPAAYARFLLDCLHITRAYGTVMVLSGTGMRLGPVVGFALLAGIALIWTTRRGPAWAGVWLAGAFPLMMRGVLRSDAEHVYAGLMPVAGILWLIALACTERPLAIFTMLSSSVFVLGWFGSHPDRPAAWSPTVIYAGAHAAPEPSRASGTELARVRDWLSGSGFSAAGPCIGLPARLGMLHATTGIRGPTETLLGWSPRLQRLDAERIASARCHSFVKEIVSFDHPPPLWSWGAGETLLAWAELYEPSGRLGPDLVVGTLRKQPLRIEQRPLIAGLLSRRYLLEDGEPISFDLGRPVPWQHLIRLSYHFDVPLASAVAGSTPLLEVQFFDGDRPLSDWMHLPYPATGRSMSILPVHPEVAEWRWVAGRAPAASRTADRMQLRPTSRGLRLGASHFTAMQFEELVPPHGVSSPKPVESSVDILRRVADRGAYSRAVYVRVDGDALVIPPAPAGKRHAEVFVPLTPSADSCLFADAFVPETKSAGPTQFEVHVIAGYQRPRVANWIGAPGQKPRPIEVPLANFAGQDVLLRFATRAVATVASSESQFLRPRVGRCATLRNLMHDFHEGAQHVLAGQVEASGDAIALHPVAIDQRPTFVELAVDVPEGACLAFDAAAKDDADGVGIAAGVFHQGVFVRLARPELPPGKSEAFRNLPLGEWTNQRVAIGFGALPLGRGRGSVGFVFRPRIHRCGDGAPWPFAR
jgi:hypothetical protein